VKGEEEKGGGGGRRGRNKEGNGSVEVFMQSRFENGGNVRMCEWGSSGPA
jgi:hypothetical protein